MKSLHNPRYRKLLDVLLDARKGAGITQQSLAKSLKKPQSYVSKYESGERRIDVIEFVAICEALNVEYRRILDKALKM